MTETPTTAPTINDELEALGYSVTPFLNQEECSRLLALHGQCSSRTNSGFYCTMFSENEMEREMVDTGIKQILQPHLQKLFPDYRPLFGNFMVKEPGEESDWPVHQDWTYVDETASDSFALWVPLVNIDSSTGQLCMVPGSHQIKNLVRGPGVTDPFQHLHELIREQLHVPLEMNAGDAAIWNHRTVHFSRPNLSEETRVAATVILVPKGVKTFHFWKDSSVQGVKIEQFAVNGCFFRRNNIFQRPESVNVVDSHKDDFPDISRDELNALFVSSLDSNYI